MTVDMTKEKKRLDIAQIITTIVALILIAAIIAGIVFVVIPLRMENIGLKAELELLKSVQIKTKHTVTAQEIEEKLEPIGELSTYEFAYDGTDVNSSYKEILNHKIWGTTNSVSYTYSGVIKVGYDIEDIEIKLDQDKYFIYIRLPEPQVLDNYLKTHWECEEKNNILNPLNISDHRDFFEEISQRELEKAEEAGIYDKAEDQVKLLITNFLAVFSDYEVVFIR